MTLRKATLLSNIGTGGLTYNLQELNVGEPGYGNITVSAPAVISATPLPAALPLFGGGLGLIGLVALRRKRKLRDNSPTRTECVY